MFPLARISAFAVGIPAFLASAPVSAEGEIRGPASSDGARATTDAIVTGAPTPRTCARYPAIGLPDTPRVADVKPTYPLSMFKASLAELPSYRPASPLKGKITIWGSDYIGSKLAHYWQEGFEKHHPDLHVEYKLVNALTAIPSVALGIGDLAPSRAASWAELFLFERVNNYPPLEIAIATGAWSFLLLDLREQGEPDQTSHNGAARRHFRSRSHGRLCRNAMGPRKWTRS